MDDYLSKDYFEQEKKYRTDALRESYGYLNARKPGEKLYKLQSIIYLLLKSYEYKIRLAKRKTELSLKGIKLDLFKKANLEKKIKDFNEKLSDLDKVLQIDFASNPYINGKLSYGLCEEFAFEDAESFTLFNEVKNYLERHAKDNDADRLQLLSRISQLKSLISNARHDTVKAEADYISNALKIIDREMNTYNDLTNKDIFAIYDDFKHSIKKNRTNPDYISQLYLSHYPKYKDKVENSFDGFGEEAKNASSDLIEYKIMLMGDKANRLIRNSNYDLNRIYDLLQRKQEVSEILSLVERVIYALDERNHVTISGESKAELNYERAIIVAQDLEKYCEVLIDKYDKELIKLKYYELEELLDETKETSQEKTSSNDYQSESKFTYVIDEKPSEVEEETHDDTFLLKEKNDQMINELDITPELLQLSIDDLCLFGFLNTNNIDELSPEDMTSVINHCIKLREIFYLNDDDKTVVRATWPRMENGKRVEKLSPNSSDILVQKNLDNMRSIISRINSYAQDTNFEL